MILENRHLEAIRRHAERAAPEECCGVLIGRRGREAEIVEVVPAQNAAEGDRRRRYAIEVRQLIETHKRARTLDLEVVGYYHSHPEGEAWPSAHDLDHAHPGVSYLIVGLEGGRAVEARAFRLRGEAFVEEKLEPAFSREKET